MMEEGSSANNQVSAEAFITTSSLLNTTDYPHHQHRSAEWVTGVAGAFQPHGGTQYLYSDRADITYKRIKRDATVPGGGRHDDLLHVLRHRAELGLRVRRGP